MPRAMAVVAMMQFILQDIAMVRAYPFMSRGADRQQAERDYQRHACQRDEALPKWVPVYLREDHELDENAPSLTKLSSVSH